MTLTLLFADLRALKEALESKEGGIAPDDLLPTAPFASITGLCSSPIEEIEKVANDQGDSSLDGKICQWKE